MENAICRESDLYVRALPGHDLSFSPREIFWWDETRSLTELAAIEIRPN